MAQLNNLIVTGNSQFIGDTFGVSSIEYTTTAPTAANPVGLKFVILSSEPATKYAGWVYLITGE